MLHYTATVWGTVLHYRATVWGTVLHYRATVKGTVLHYRATVTGTVLHYRATVKGKPHGPSDQQDFSTFPAKKKIHLSVIINRQKEKCHGGTCVRGP